jgi:hypothetical protein
MVDTFFDIPPKTKWEVLLSQVVLYSYKQFCMARLAEEDSASQIAEPLDLSGGLPVSQDHLWSTQYELVSHFAPEKFKPYLEEWWKPEIISELSYLEDLDTYLRELTTEFDEALLTNNFEKQTAIAELLEEDFALYFDSWIPEEFHEYRFFPSPEESDVKDEVFDAILKRLYPTQQEKQQKLHKKTRRVHGRRAITPLRNSLSKIRKTRRSKQKDEILQITASSSSDGSERN